MMEHNSKGTTLPGGRAARRAFPIYFGISLAVALAFFAATSIAGDYPAVARYGGTLWLLLLTMIVTMPLVIPRVKERSKR